MVSPRSPLADEAPSEGMIEQGKQKVLDLPPSTISTSIRSWQRGPSSNGGTPTGVTSRGSSATMPARDASSDPLLLMSGGPPCVGSSSEEEDDELRARTRSLRPRAVSGISVGSSNTIRGPNGFAHDQPLYGRDTLIVEITLPPLKTVRRYGHLFGTQRPTQASRLDLDLNDSVDPYRSSSSSSSAPLPRRRGRPPRRQAVKRYPNWRVASSPLLDDDDFDESEVADSEMDDSEDSDDDEIVLRRSHRAGVEGRSRGESRIRTRAQYGRKTESTSRTSSPTRKRRFHRHSIPETSFYGSTARNAGRPRKSQGKMRPEPRAERRKYEDEDEFDYETGSAGHEGTDLGAEEVMEVDELSSSWKASEGEAEDSAQMASEDALSRHRAYCEKCSRGPASEMLVKARARKKKPGKRKRKDDEELSDEELASQLEGWLECEKCCVSSHWDCIAPTQKKATLNTLMDQEGPPLVGQRRRMSVRIDEKATFVCAKCTADPTCFVCHEDDLISLNAKVNGEAKKEEDAEQAVDGEDQSDRKAGVKFRCSRCRLACHYDHLENPNSGDARPSLAELVDHYQRPEDSAAGWTCHQCRAWIRTVDIVCAWRPNPADAKEDVHKGEVPHYKDPLPREYLVKWTGRGFRHVTWVPHAWLLATSQQKLRNFLEKGPALDLVTDETLAAHGDDLDRPTIAHVMEEDDRVQGEKGGFHHGAPGDWAGGGPAPDVNAESSIPAAWRTVDRVLDIMLLPPKPKIRLKLKEKDTDRNKLKRNRVVSLSASPSLAPEKRHRLASPDRLKILKTSARPDGVDPPQDEKIDIDEWEERSRRVLTEDDAEEVAGLVTWCFVKWDDLQYDQSCWDTPPPLESYLYPAFKRALGRFLGARQVEVPVLSPTECRKRDLMAGDTEAPPETQPTCIVGGTLMPFQMEGFQWLLYKHFKRESCILADDMGLGKTIQIASLLGYLGSEALKVYPCLVVVPNSTITNWVREFEKWVPHMRVVPYYGEAPSRKIISKYELYHKGLQGKAAGLKAHVVLTTYDMITGNEFRVFGGIPRWEVLCVDEGQRLKSDNSLIFNRLKTLNSVHRVLLTGTPLNNNLRELFNLLNFLDPDTFRYLTDLEKRFEKLSESLVQELHEMIKPYILRRIKADVLKLPPKIEIIVPISLAPLQKNVYKTILERNADVMKAIVEAKRKKQQQSSRAVKALL